MSIRIFCNLFGHNISLTQQYNSIKTNPIFSRLRSLQISHSLSNKLCNSARVLQSRFPINEYWGLSADYSPDWTLSDSQKKLRSNLIDVCQSTIRPEGIRCDETYKFPHKSIKALASLNLLGLITPKELGGLSESHVSVSMVIETIARYGCPSTAMIYTMHLGAVATLLMKYHNQPHLTDLLSRLDRECLLGTISTSDPATGSHSWMSLSSKSQSLDDQTTRVLKFGSWATSAGEADWYVIQAVSPHFKKNYASLDVYLAYKDEVRYNSNDWKSLGMHGNQSGPIMVDCNFSNERLVGNHGEGGKILAESGVPYIVFCTSAVWNGLALACMDVAKAHVTQKTHGDVDMRICEYPSVQDYFGSCIASTNASRALLHLVMSALDAATSDNAWPLQQPKVMMKRAQFSHWMWQAKLFSSDTVSDVSEKMLQATGGSGYKSEVGLERLLRDAKAGKLMAPSNEVLKLWIGHTALMGLKDLDIWNRNPNPRKLHQELEKLSSEEKKQLLDKLQRELEEDKEGVDNSYQDSDFDNPFSTAPPTYSKEAVISADGTVHHAALCPNDWTVLKLSHKKPMTECMTSYLFKLPHDSDYTGLLPGQYLELQVIVDGKPLTRYFSPTSPTSQFGVVELVNRHETSGSMSTFFSTIKPGDSVQFRGPCGGFEYSANSSTSDVTLIASGSGVTPCLQIVRQVMADRSDMTRLNLLYFSETLEELLCREELRQYQDSDDRLRVYFTLGESPPNWEGGKGFIDCDVIAANVDMAVPPHKHKFLICGGPAMTMTCVRALHTLGVPSDRVFIYGPLGTNQLRIVYGKAAKLSTHRL